MIEPCAARLIGVRVAPKKNRPKRRFFYGYSARLIEPGSATLLSWLDSVLGSLDSLVCGFLGGVNGGSACVFGGFNSSFSTFFSSISAFLGGVCGFSSGIFRSVNGGISRFFDSVNGSFSAFFGSINHGRRWLDHNGLFFFAASGQSQSGQQGSEQE